MVHNPTYAPRYEAPPSFDPKDVARVVVLFHQGGDWNAERRAEWLRITGTREATTKVLCDHMREFLLHYVDADTGCGLCAMGFEQHMERDGSLSHMVRGTKNACTSKRYINGN